MSECPECGKETGIEPEFKTYGQEFNCPHCNTALEVLADDVCNCTFDDDYNVVDTGEGHYWNYYLERVD